jgi:hypothetical protein
MFLSASDDEGNMNYEEILNSSTKELRLHVTTSFRISRTRTLGALFRTLS